jgi:hypothetical protein
MPEQYNHIGVSCDRGYEEYVCNLVKTSVKFYKGTKPLLFELFTNDFNFSFDKFLSLNTGGHKQVVTYINKAFHEKWNIPFDFSKQYLIPDEQIAALKRLNVDIREENTLKTSRFLGNLTSPYDKYMIFDADMLVAGDLHEVFEFDLKDNYIAACKTHFYSSNYQSEQAFYDKLDNGLISNELLIPFSLFNVNAVRNDRLLYKLLDEVAARLKDNLTPLFNGHSNYIGSAPFFGRIFSELAGDRIDYLDSSWSFDTDFLRNKRVNDGSTIDYFKENPPKLYHFNARKISEVGDKNILTASNNYIKNDYYNLVLNTLLND